MTTTTLKNNLFEKLQNENCYFSKSDISIKTLKDSYKIVIKDYEHIPFVLTLEKDDYFGYMIFIKDCFEDKNIIFVDSKKEYNYKEAMLQLGYYIASRF